MNELVELARDNLGYKKNTIVRLPYFAGLLAGLLFDSLKKITRKTYPVSLVRVKKFCATTSFSSSARESGFQARMTLEAGLSNTIKAEFIKQDEMITFDTE